MPAVNSWMSRRIVKEAGIENGPRERVGVVNQNVRFTLPGPADGQAVQGLEQVCLPYS